MFDRLKGALTMLRRGDLIMVAVPPVGEASLILLTNDKTGNVRASEKAMFSNAFDIAEELFEAFVKEDDYVGYRILNG